MFLGPVWSLLLQVHRYLFTVGQNVRSRHFRPPSTLPLSSLSQHFSCLGSSVSHMFQCPHFKGKFSRPAATKSLSNAHSRPRPDLPDHRQPRYLHLNNGTDSKQLKTVKTRDNREDTTSSSHRDIFPSCVAGTPLPSFSPVSEVADLAVV